MNTSTAHVADRVRSRAQPRGIQVLDAPLSGISKGADAGLLQIFVGHNAGDLTSRRPLLEVVGDPSPILHVGSHGPGCAIKLMINPLCFVKLVGIGSTLLEQERLPLLRDGELPSRPYEPLAGADLRLSS